MCIEKKTVAIVEYTGEDGGHSFVVTETKDGLELEDIRAVYGKLALSWNDWARLKSAIEMLEIE